MKSYEDLLNQIGSFGVFQKRLCLYLIISSVPNGYFALSIVFIGITPPHRCYVDITNASNSSSSSHLTQNRLTTSVFNNSQVLEKYIPKNINKEFSECEIYDYLNGTTMERPDNITLEKRKCPNGWIYESDRTTIVTEWDFVCSDAWLQPTVAFLFMVGVLVGALFSGFFSDKFGRRPVFLFGTATMFVFFGLCGVAPSPGAYYVLIFLAGASNMINYTAAFVLGSEVIDTKKRALVGSLVVGGFALGYMIIPVVAYFIHNWRYIYVATGFTGCFFIPYYWLISESPRWLLCCGRHQEFREAMMRIARINGVSEDEIDAIFEQCIDESDQQKIQITMKDFVQFIRYKTVRLLSLCYSWFINAVVYYGLSLNTSNLGGNPYWNCFIAGAVEIPAYALCIFTLDKLGRKKLFQATVLLTAASCGLIPILEIASTPLSICFTMLGKFFISCSFNILFIYTAELYPTTVRNTAVGLGSVFARIGAAVSPYLIYIEKTSSFLPYIIMMVLGVLSAIFTQFLPETKHKPMLDLLDEKNYKNAKDLTSEPLV